MTAFVGAVIDLPINKGSVTGKTNCTCSDATQRKTDLIEIIICIYHPYHLAIQPRVRTRIHILYRAHPCVSTYTDAKNACANFRKLAAAKERYRSFLVIIAISQGKSGASGTDTNFWEWQSCSIGPGRTPTQLPKAMVSRIKFGIMLL